LEVAGARVAAHGSLGVETYVIDPVAEAVNSQLHHKPQRALTGFAVDDRSSGGAHEL
jgi:hypothetical protein